MLRRGNARTFICCTTLWNRHLIAGLLQVTLAKVGVKSGWWQGLQQVPFPLCVLFPSKAVCACPRWDVSSLQKAPSLTHPAIISAKASGSLISCSRNKIYFLLRDSKTAVRDSTVRLLAANTTPHILLWWRRPVSASTWNLELCLQLTLCKMM